MRSPIEIAQSMAAYRVNPQEQVAQTEFRCSVVEAWPISAGMSVLEVGCGQGDMTAVLAESVGLSGTVTAIDYAPPTYGAPLTLGESMRHLLDGPTGSRLDVRFEFDLLEKGSAFPDRSFDVSVLAHSSWYFASPSQLAATFRELRRCSDRLCFSEWDLEMRSLDQQAHWLSAMIQAGASGADANIRTPLAKEEVIALAEQAGWSIVSEAVVDSSSLADGKWEVDLCLNGNPAQAPTGLVATQLELLRRLSDGQHRSLHSYSLVAE